MSQHMFPIIYREVIKNPLILSDKNIGESIISTALMRCSMVNRTPITWVRKLTPYEIHWADLMVIPDLRNTSQLHMLNASQGADFISACIKTLLAMQETGIIGIPVIALNQQRDCTEISTKYAPDGEELKVQTLDELHAHVFIEDETGIKYPTLAKLQKSINKKDASAKVDFFDPIA